MLVPLYGSSDSTLWTPAQTGSISLSSVTIGMWIDGEDPSYFSTASDGSGNLEITELTERSNNITFGPVSGFTNPRYTNDDASYVINSRNGIWFWEDSLQYTPDCALTSSAGAFDGLIPANNENRAVFSVFKTLRLRGLGSNNFIYQYGVNNTNQGYGLAIYATSSAISTDPELFFLPRWGAATNYTNGANYLYTNPNNAQLIYQQHASTGDGIITADAQQTNYSYSGLTLNTQTPTQFWLGEELSGGGVGIDFVLAEIIVLSDIPDTTDRQIIEGYLAHKWGLTTSLPVSHPYKTSAPTNGTSQQFPITQSIPPGQDFSPSFVDQRMAKLPYQYDRSSANEFAPIFRLSVRGPSNLRLRQNNTVYKVTKE